MWWHQTITGTNIGWWTKRSCVIHMRATAQEMLKISIPHMLLKITQNITTKSSSELLHVLLKDQYFSMFVLWICFLQKSGSEQVQYYSERVEELESQLQDSRQNVSSLESELQGMLICESHILLLITRPTLMGWVGLWGFLWWAPSAKRKDHRVWHRSNTGLSSTQYEQIPIILGVWPFWLTPFVFRSKTFWWAYG